MWREDVLVLNSVTVLRRNINGQYKSVKVYTLNCTVQLYILYNISVSSALYTSNAVMVTVSATVITTIFVIMVITVIILFIVVKWWRGETVHSPDTQQSKERYNDDVGILLIDFLYST